MPALRLIITNKRYSSWSLRPWIALHTFGIAFEEQLSPLDMATNNAHFSEFSPTKRVPVLIDGDATVWESLAILDYLADTHPQHRWWPAERVARARARAIAAEMHAGFPALRNECPMNMQRRPARLAVSESCQIDVSRIETLMAACYADQNGEFLFGAFGIVDAMLAPVVNRIRIYQLTRHPDVIRFCRAIESLPAWQQWLHDSATEPWVLDALEV